MVPWPVISPTLPRKPSNAGCCSTLPTSLPPPSPTLSWIFTSPHHHPRHHHPSVPIFHLSLYSVISSFHLCLRLSHLHFILDLSRLLCFNIQFSLHLFIAAFVDSQLRLNCAIVLQTACESIRACQRTRRPTDQTSVATPLKASFYVSRKYSYSTRLTQSLHHSS